MPKAASSTTRKPRAQRVAAQGIDVARIEKIERTLEEQRQTSEHIVAAMNRLTDAINNPVAPSRYAEAAERDLGGEGVAEFREDGDEQLIERPSLGDVDNPLFKEKLENMAWDQQMLEVHIHESADKDAQQVFEITVNGESELFRRGERKRVKRMFVEGLARAKPISYSNEEYLGGDGRQHVRYPTHKGLRYPFALVNPSARDNAWLNSILAQP